MVERDPNWTPVPLTNAWVGHLVTGVVTGVGVFIALAIASWVFAATNGHSIALPALAFLVFIGWLATETISTAVDQWQAQRHQHNSPGGLIAAGSRVIIFLAVYTITGILIPPTVKLAVICGVVAAVVALIETLALKSWQPGLDTAEIRRAWSETKEMTEKLVKEEK